MTDAAKDAEVSERMAIDMYGWYRDVCTLSAPIVLGGPGVIIQIDESLFHHKPKVNFIIVSKSYRIIISDLDTEPQKELPQMKCGYLD